MSKVALITGAGSGIGRAAALAFAGAGAKTVVADVAEQAGEATVELIREAGGEAVFVRVDVASSGSVENMVNQTVKTTAGSTTRSTTRGTPVSAVLR